MLPRFSYQESTQENNKGNVILVNYSGKPSYYAHYVPDLSLAYISAAIKTKGYETILFDLNHLSVEPQDVINSISDIKPLFVGMKLMGNGMPELIELAHAIKRVSPNTLIVAGGPQVTTFRERVFTITDIFDFLIYGEGEKATIELIEFLEGSRNVKAVRNLIYRSNGNITTNLLILEKELDSIPYPDWSLFKLEEYFPLFMLNMVRGCQYQCAFCSHNYLWGRETPDETLTEKNINEIRKHNLVRKRSWNNIEGEIVRNINNYHVSLFDVIDSTPDIPLLSTFSRYIVNNKIAVNWVSFGRIGYYNKNLYETFSLSGCIAMWYGIESGNETMLQNMNKEYTLDNVRKTIKIAKEAGIKTICSFIVGFPGETAETLKDSLRFINEIKPDTTVMIPFVLQRGSPVAYFPQYYGVELHEDWIDKVLKPWNEREQHQIDYYTISGMPNTIWLEQFKDQSGYKDRIDKSESTDYEIAELLSALLGIPRRDFVQKINDAINKKDLSTLRYFISMAWEISKQHIEG